MAIKFNPKFLEARTIFDTEDNAFLTSYQAIKFTDLPEARLMDLCVGYCYYSAKIEGNTYNFIETETLLKDEVTAPKRYEDAIMIKNLYNALNANIAYSTSTTNIELDRYTIKQLHSVITDQLLAVNERGVFRSSSVGIGGTEYVPCESYMIDEYMDKLLQENSKIDDVISKAIHIHLNVAYLQPFIDGNKRTARMLQDITLISNNMLPMFSARAEDISKYRSAILSYYETGNYKLFKNFFMDVQRENIAKLVVKSSSLKNIENDIKGVVEKQTAKIKLDI